MGKTLVSEDRIDRFICPETNTLYTAGLVLTPGARDALKARGVAICNGTGPEASKAPCTPCAPCDPKDAALVATIVRLLKDEFEVRDPEACRLICESVFAALKKA